MASRKIEDCVIALQDKFFLFDLRMKAVGIPFLITCTARTVKEQIAFYAQGRETLKQTNALRKMAGLPPISPEENARKVTWTLNSKHLVDLDDGNPGNDKSRAFDIVITRNGKPCWDVKADVNQNQIADYVEAGRIGKSVGLIWGGNFRTPDMPHFEI